MLPPIDTPLNQHSLSALELWLTEFGAYKSDKDSCLWTCSISQYVVEIRLERDYLKINWFQDGKISERLFSYGLSRKDIQDAINEGI